MSSHVPFLGTVHVDEPHAIAVDSGQGVTNLIEPEIEVGHLPGQLVRVEGDEPRQLVGDEFRHVRGERHVEQSAIEP